MARQIGGGDNVMGSKEAIVNVSFKDDLGNILENASQLKDILDAVNQNFLAINSAVGITTQSMGRLASQTQRLVATTQQLRNEYQTIADASQRIGLSQSISSPNSIFQNTDVVRDALSGTGSARGLILPGGEQESVFGRTLGIKPGEFVTEQYPSRLRRTQPWNQIGRSEVRDIAHIQRQLKSIDASIQDPNTPDEIRKRLLNQESQLKSELITAQSRPESYKRGKFSRGYIPPSYFDPTDKTNNPFEQSVGSQVWEDWQAGASTSTIVRGLLTSNVRFLGMQMGGAGSQFLAAAMPYIAAGIGVGVAGYKAADYLVKGATRYSGLTGGTGVFANTGAAEGTSSFLGLQERAWREGFFNMAVGPGGYQQIQESLLGAGYTARSDANYARLGIKGLRYEGARSFLASMYGKGLQDVDQNLQLMQLVVERGGGSLTALGATIDNLRNTALTTNASLKVMTATLATSMAGLIGGMNVAGNIAAFVGGNNASAYANAENTLLRGSGAPNYNDFITQMMMLQSPSFQGAGVTANNMFYMMAHPEKFTGGQEGMAIARATDYSVDRMFTAGFRIAPGTSLETAKDIIGQNSNYVRAIMQSPMFKAAVNDPNITNSVDATIEWLARNAIGSPQTDAAKKSREQSLAHNIEPTQYSIGNLRNPYAKGRFNLGTPRVDADAYLRKKFGNSTSIKGRLVQAAGVAEIGAVLAGAGVVSVLSGGALSLPAMALATAYSAPGVAMIKAGEGMTGGLDDGAAHDAYYDYVRATGKTAGWAEAVLNNPDKTTAGRTYVKYGDQIIGFKKFMEEAKTNKQYQAALEGKGQTLYIGEKQKGESKDDITKWTESGEIGGGGGSNKAIMNMTQDDFVQAFYQGINRFNHKGEPLKVKGL